jgi:hypothetical protein
MSEADVTLAWIDIWLNCLKRDCKQESRKDFTMQNCLVNKRNRMAFLSKHFNSLLAI